MDETDNQRTKLLDLPGYKVLKRGDDPRIFFVDDTEPIEKFCPVCMSENLRNQGSRERMYIDLLKSPEFPFIYIVYSLRKFKCRCCGKVFFIQPTFAEPYSRLTNRLVDAIVRGVLSGGFSYEYVSQELCGEISRQVVGQIFNRRCEQLCSCPPLWFQKLLKEDFWAWCEYTSRDLPVPDFLKNHEF